MDHYDGIKGSPDTQPALDVVVAAASFSNKKRPLERQLSSGGKKSRRTSKGSNLDNSGSWDELQIVSMREKFSVDESGDNAAVNDDVTIITQTGGAAVIGHNNPSAPPSHPPRPQRFDVPTLFVDDDMLADGRRGETVQNAAMIRSPNGSSSGTSGGQPVRCPRCDSQETKYCYNNNYNASQPRYYCKVRFTMLFSAPTKTPAHISRDRIAFRATRFHVHPIPPPNDSYTCI